MRRAVALFSGGLDSTLAVRIMQQQGFVVDAIHVRTPYACCKLPAAQAASALGVELSLLPVGDDYFELIRRPAHGYGRAVNPCIDCRIYMCKMAARLLEERGASVVVTGEVLGQRPTSQRRVALSLIEQESGLAGRLLRPLSARLLPPTIGESEGWIDRERLYAFHGRSRKGLRDLARQLAIRISPGTSGGCALTAASFAPRVRDLLRFSPRAGRWEFELLSLGRHVRASTQAKFVVARNAAENAALDQFFLRTDGPERRTLVEPASFPGPKLLIAGAADEATLALAGALVARYARQIGSDAMLRVSCSGTSRLMRLTADCRACDAATL